MNKKQEKILNTSTKLFIQYGVKKTTMDDIANTGNISKVTIYKYFGDKESLYLAVGKFIFEHYLYLLKNHVSNDKVIDEKLANVMDTLVDFVISNKLTLCEDLSKLNDALQSEYCNFNAEYKRSITRLIDEGRDIGKIKKEISSDIVFYYIDMGISYFQNNVDYRQKMLSDTAFQNEFIDFILSNIFIKDGEYNN